MKIISILALVVGFVASAASYTCEDAKGKLRAKLILGKDSNTLILSNPTVGAGRKTIAKFTDLELADEDFISVSTKVDFRNKELRRGELIGGTRLGQLKSIGLSIEESEEQSGEDLGELKLVKRTGRVLYVDMVCTLTK